MCIFIDEGWDYTVNVVLMIDLSSACEKFLEAVTKINETWCFVLQQVDSLSLMAPVMNYCRKHRRSFGKYSFHLAG